MPFYGRKLLVERYTEGNHRRLEPEVDVFTSLFIGIVVDIAYQKENNHCSYCNQDRIEQLYSDASLKELRADVEAESKCYEKKFVLQEIHYSASFVNL